MILLENSENYQLLLNLFLNLEPNIQNLEVKLAKVLKKLSKNELLHILNDNCMILGLIEKY